MSHLVLVLFVSVRLTASRVARRCRVDERGEGVISAAIAVLIMAFLGALMWVAFKEVFTGTTQNTKNQVDQIGR